MPLTSRAFGFYSGASAARHVSIFSYCELGFGFGLKVFNSALLVASLFPANGVRDALAIAFYFAT